MAKFLFLILILAKFFSLISSKSLTFVMDTSDSMKFELDYIQNAMSNFHVGNYVDDFIVLPFNDPEIGPITKTTNFEEFKSVMTNLTANGKRECHDLLLEALQRALEKSSHESHIYVFSDAEVEDPSSLNDIKQLCQKTKSRVSIIHTKTCLPRGSNQDVVFTSIYRNITDSCGGELISFNPYNLRNVFKFIHQVIQWDPVEFTTDHTVRCDGMEHYVSLDNNMAEVLLLFIGNVNSPVVIRDGNSTSNVEQILNSRSFKVFNVKEPTQSLKVTCRSNNQVIIKIGECNDFDFKIGFSPFKPTVMEETTPIPMANVNWYILIECLQKDLVPKEIEISVPGKEKKTYYLVQTDNKGSKLYVSGSFRVPDKTFRIIIIAIDETGYSTRQISPSIPVQIIGTPVISTVPTGEIIDTYETNIVDYGSDRHIVCKVTGFPSPTVWWTDSNRNSYGSETAVLKYPDVYISYGYIKNITTNTTYECNYRNSEGSGKQGTEVFVKFMTKFIVMEEPQDMVVDVYSQGTLKCEVDAVPAAIVKWYLNDTLITYNQNLDMDGNELTIKRMNFDDIGTYMCVVDNSIEHRTFEAKVSISGYEFPSVSLDREDVIQVKSGDFFELECTAQGKPEPEIRWSFRANLTHELQDLRNDISVYGGKLTINEVKPHHRGFYRCEAINGIGSDCLDVEIQTGNPPRIIQRESLVTVKERQHVELPCNVESTTAVKVRWELYQDGNRVEMDDRHKTDKYHTHRFPAWWKDGGVYRCIAENEDGRAERDTTLNVLVTPYIKPVNPNPAYVKIGQEVNLPCIIQFGNPTPRLSWKFKQTNSTKIMDIWSSSENLVLQKFSLHNEGEYTCSAENEVGYDQIKITLLSIN